MKTAWRHQHYRAEKQQRRNLPFPSHTSSALSFPSVTLLPLFPPPPVLVAACNPLCLSVSTPAPPSLPLTPARRGSILKRCQALGSSAVQTATKPRIPSLCICPLARLRSPLPLHLLPLVLKHQGALPGHSSSLLFKQPQLLKPSPSFPPLTRLRSSLPLHLLTLLLQHRRALALQRRQKLLPEGPVEDHQHRPGQGQSEARAGLVGCEVEVLDEGCGDGDVCRGKKSGDED